MNLIIYMQRIFQLAKRKKKNKPWTLFSPVPVPVRQEQLSDPTAAPTLGGEQRLAERNSDSSLGRLKLQLMSQSVKSAQTDFWRGCWLDLVFDLTGVRVEPVRWKQRGNQTLKPPAQV